MKTCFKCNQEKALSEFYKFAKMKDGYLGKCKVCTLKDTGRYRSENLEYYRALKRRKGNKVKEENKVWAKKDKKKFPAKYKAQNKVTNALRNGNLIRHPCEVCGSEKYIHAHHDDYAEPLNVKWLCAIHHSKWHKENGAGLNGR